MTFCYILSTSDTINLCILIVYCIMAIFLALTFIQGQKQTRTSLSINQFNIFYNELKDLIEDAGQIFNNKVREDVYLSIKKGLETLDGINYISLFTFTWQAKNILRTDPENDTERKAIEDFRHFVLFPLEKYYDKLLAYLDSVKKDNVLEEHHKKLIYNKIERDILQTYFRIANNARNGIKEYDLATFQTTVYNPENSFYRINQFYIQNKVFQYKDLKFYMETL